MSQRPHQCSRALPRRSPQSAARLWSPASGRALEVLTTAPGLGLYTGNALDGGLAGKAGVRYPQHAGVVLQAQARTRCLSVACGCPCAHHAAWSRS